MNRQNRASKSCGPMKIPLIFSRVWGLMKFTPEFSSSERFAPSYRQNIAGI
jgi:hypothetical protein